MFNTYIPLGRFLRSIGMIVPYRIPLKFFRYTTWPFASTTSIVNAKMISLRNWMLNRPLFGFGQILIAPARLL